MTETVLDRIKAYKLEEVAAAKAAKPLRELESEARDAPHPRDFQYKLRSASEKGYGLIAEIKKASPSKGLIRADFDPPALAKAYASGGAACLSVLTDTPSFQGSPEYLRAVRRAVSLPILRKDFIYDPYQVAEARAWGADCILIIMASVTDPQARELEDAARSWGMSAIAEVHDAEEMARASALRTPMIGINNRDLKTFDTDLETTVTLAARAPYGKMLISESGLHTRDDLARMAHAGVRCFLIGESLMRKDDVAAATSDILAHPVLPERT